MSLRSILKFFPALAAIAPLSLAAGVPFGRFGKSLDQAKTTPFFTWFHLEQISERGDEKTFQPSGEKFHDLVKVIANAKPGDGFRYLSLAVKRSFIDGPDSPFARDIVKSFLETLAAGAPTGPELKDLINQIWYSPSGGRTVIVNANMPRPQLPAQPTPAYRTFLGLVPHADSLGVQGKILSIRNEDGWFLLSVAPSARFCCAPRKEPLPRKQ